MNTTEPPRDYMVLVPGPDGQDEAVSVFAATRAQLDAWMETTELQLQELAQAVEVVRVLIASLPEGPCDAPLGLLLLQSLEGVPHHG